MRLQFGTKAENLKAVADRLEGAHVLPLHTFSAQSWGRSREAVLADLAALSWIRPTCIVRSSCGNEDQLGQSLAGHFLSVPNVNSPKDLPAAIDQVIASFSRSVSSDDEVLIQPMLEHVTLSGVAFSRDPSTRAPYNVINFEKAGDTTAVTSGKAQTETFIHWKNAPPPADEKMAQVVMLVSQLEKLFGHDSLDIEFAFDDKNQLFLFQVRPLVIEGGGLAIEDHRKVLQLIADRVEKGCVPDPFIRGRRTLYGIMPDWNPAEIIGTRPRPLALSLYRELVTDNIWAYQRNNYGYKNLRSCPLLVHFHGLPYIDVRVSFNSFVPADIEDALAERLVNYYIERLIDNPQLHDKVEFEIVFSCYVPTLPDDIQVLKQHGFRDVDLTALTQSLRHLTNNIIHHKRGLWRGDLEKLKILERRRETLLNSNSDPISRIYWLMEDCKRYGSLPFAGLARAGFIAVQLLKSLVKIGILSRQDYDLFMASLDTVSSQMARDRIELDRMLFLKKYGHLRPGTYDLLSPRYDEAADEYFDWNSTHRPHKRDSKSFALSLTQMKDISHLLEANGLENDIVTFFEFVKAGIEGREYAKFVFTRNLSDAMSLFRDFGQQYGFNEQEMAYADIGIVREMYLSSGDPRNMIEQSIAQGRARFDITQQIILPPLISSPSDVWSFHIATSEPNFITLKTVSAPVVNHEQRDMLKDAIVAIPSADPGFDWLFSYPIAGLITAYGGANSHMAIRAGELGLPAIIGAGQVLYSKWSRAGMLAIDCSNRVVTVIR